MGVYGAVGTGRRCELGSVAIRAKISHRPGNNGYLSSRTRLHKTCASLKKLGKACVAKGNKKAKKMTFRFCGMRKEKRSQSTHEYDKD